MGKTFNVLQALTIHFIVLLPVISYAGIDYTCYLDCTKKGYFHKLCQDKCSYSDTFFNNQVAQPSLTQHVNPFMKIIEGYAAGRRARQEEDLMQQQIELQRLEAERIRQEIDLLKKENEYKPHAPASKKEYKEPTARLKYTDYDQIINDYFFPYAEKNPSLWEIINSSENPSELAYRIGLGIKRKEEDTKRQNYLDYFEANVKPKILKVHPDFDSIIMITRSDGTRESNKEYFEWAEKQRPALRYAAIESSDPDDIIWAISEYKKSKQKDKK